MVRRCCRGDCENIMCERYSKKYGYICEECFKELVGLGPNTNIKEFMESDCNEFNMDYSEKIYNQIFSKE